MIIEVFGPGCHNCKELERMVYEAVTLMGVDAKIEKVTDIMKMAEAGIMMPPGVRINGVLKSSGRLPKLEDLKKWIEEAK